MEERKTASPKRTSKAQFVYDSFLGTFPKPGGGGAHVGFYKAGVLGFKLGYTSERIVGDVKAHMPEGTRRVSDKEIEEGVTAGFRAALLEATGEAPERVARLDPVVPSDAFARVASSNRGVTYQDIMARSPVPLDFPEREGGWRLVEALYRPEEFLYIGGAKEAGELGGNVRTAAEWATELKKGPPAFPHIIANPLSGELAPTKDGLRQTYRGDGNVCRYCHLVMEMDNASLEDQLAFWSWAALPVRALIMSGGKSIHGWVAVDCENAQEWEKEVENDLFPRYLEPLGADKAGKNESRVSRLPGYTRPEGDKYAGSVQRLIWLSPEGKAVCE